MLAQSRATAADPKVANIEWPAGGPDKRTNPRMSNFRGSHGGFEEELLAKQQSIHPPKRRHRSVAELLAPHAYADDCASDEQAADDFIRCAFVESREHSCSNWSAPMDRITLSQCPLFTITNQVHEELDAAPSTRLQDLSILNENEIAVLYERLHAQIAQLHTAYTRLLSHLDSARAISTETESLVRQCFFLQHNISQQFDMFGMDRCACHAREVESRLILMPPVHKQYPLEELSEEASQQVKFIWSSPFLLLQLITAYQLHMAKHVLPIPAAGV